jgi:hypothetical protein
VVVEAMRVEGRPDATPAKLATRKQQGKETKKRKEGGMVGNGEKKRKTGERESV